MEKKIALDADFIAFKPKIALTKEQVKATLAIMNSSFTQFQIEQRGKDDGGRYDFRGSKLIPDIRTLSGGRITKLASHFDDLEEKARLVDGADKHANMEKLRPIVEKNDVEIPKITGLSKYKQLRK